MEMTLLSADPLSPAQGGAGQGQRHGPARPGDWPLQSGRAALGPDAALSGVQGYPDAGLLGPSDTSPNSAERGTGLGFNLGRHWSIAFAFVTGERPRLGYLTQTVTC